MTEDTNRFQPPSAELDLPRGGQKPDLKTLYTSFSGRISRKVFWIYGVLLMIAGTLIVFGIIAAISSASGTLAMILAVPAYIALIWVSLAMQAKRWHDRNKSAWWILIGLIPVIGGLWALIETGFLRGTVGANRFGDDLTDQY